jgi:hypothetical protein
MEKELALRTIGYLIGHYKTHEETIINNQEIEAINYILDENERLQTQLKKQKEVIDKIKHILNNQMNYREFVDIVNDIEDILKEVSE